MENRTPGFHIELPMVNIKNDAAAALLSLSKVGAFEAKNTRNLEYVDTYWDTRRGDLYSSSRVLRTRKKGGEIDFIDYKGSPQYLFQSLFARPLFSEKVKGTQEAIDAIGLKRPSGPMQALYNDRLDLLGNELVKVIDCVVKRTNFDLFTASGEGFCTISVHKYHFDMGSGQGDPEELVEIQPYCKSPVITEKLPKIFGIAKVELEKLGWMLSPTSKYHRVDRKLIDALL